ncbi:MAG: hypothetical protein KDC98_06330, partial [Planctomycetes bacterium]|nr:hypothetical protein [Planctomycetota bacterium]
MKVASWLLPVVSLAIVLFITWYDFGGTRAGPGPLNPAHERALRNHRTSGCDACHQSGAGIDAKACTECHEAIGDQLARSTGVHGNLPAADRELCGSCHSDHHGDTVTLLPPYSFVRAEVDVKDYDHRHVTFALKGAHAALTCERCHLHAAEFDPPAGGRFLGLEQSCTGCHDDSHDGGYGQDCESCHGQEQEWRKAPGFPHADFPLSGGHAGVACAQCHADSGPHSTATLRLEPQPARACAGCHDNPHGGNAAAPTALLLPKVDDCKRCHDASEWKSARPTPAQHETFGFAL